MNVYGYPAYHGYGQQHYAHPAPIYQQRPPQVYYNQPPAGPSSSGPSAFVPPMHGLPQPPPSIAFDVNEFARFYRFGLQQLVGNNKYIINDLTILADNFKFRMAAPIAREIEQHLREVVPYLKLPVFYVIDSICKNVGAPYPNVFRPFIEMAVLTAYREVEDEDPNAVIKYHELFGTWRTSGPNRTELFGEAIQKRIEGGVFGHWGRTSEAQGNEAYQSGARGVPAAAEPMEKANVLYDLRKILTDREKIAESFPNDEANLAQIRTLQQLEQLVISQQLTLIQVDEIRQQLQQIRPPTPPPARAAEPEPIPTPVEVPLLGGAAVGPELASAFQSIDPTTLASLTAMLAANPSLLLQAAQQTGNMPQVGGEAQAAVSEALAHPHDTQAAAHAMAQPDVAQGLADSGLFTNSALAEALAAVTGTHNGVAQGSSEHVASASTPVEAQEPTATPGGEDDPYIADYEEAVASLDLELSTAASTLSKPRPGLHSFLYSRIPQFCRQDGARYLRGPTGEKRSSDHIDTLFRLNRRVRESHGRAQRRIWATKEEEWVVARDFGVGDENGPSAKGKGKASAEVGAALIVDPDTRTVPKPEGAEASRPCPVCQEPFATRFDEEEEEFLWTNAVKVEGSGVWHYTCRAETLANRTKVAKVKAEGERSSRSGSRESTPSAATGRDKEVKGTPLRDQVLGKRKSATPEAGDAKGFAESSEHEFSIKRVKAEPTE